MPLRWYFFVIGPAVAVALLWLIGASLDPGPSPVRSPLHASAQSKPVAGASAKTTTGVGNAAGAATSSNAGSRSTAAAPAAGSAPASAPAPDAATTSTAANV